MRIAVVGTGVIGASWTALFLAHGHEVIATDPAPDAEERLRSALPDSARLTFTHDLAEAARSADFVQENGPERPEAKDEIFAVLDEHARAGVVLASSSSGLLPSRIQQACTRHPDRVLVGHPFNPPHLLPLVEVVPGTLTSEETVAAAMDLYTALGKRPIRLRAELPGHIANRLQAALWREAYSLVERGAATVADIDTAIANGPGLRWALLGPFLNQHLSGGPGGIAHVLEHLGPPMEDWWADLGDPRLTPELTQKIVSGVAHELSGTDESTVAAARDELLTGLLAAKARTQGMP
ncbi:3-hydroxyacyl-CoA dehydrogenase NAD-binding domain-containing protein [Actinomadura rupiterrae]|uniref:3-hydroxyacyl-CoA dehydrogenase NAD-binding domain-containing protein n=1 Tax=Actinomadura rupiterrae TaxID=559627 RepID=UPI0020A27C29|nr:3-hydroxyacyl-CoA dehydrogenase NAD-binding domain-containing protein [Actinomadura rupiterrae]MCP2341562.1 3-hydroxyacyl-CoA dehydrogenase [Actinomadura rupiterrae]